MKGIRETLKIIYKALDDKFGIEIVILDISSLSIVADYFVIASGGNPSQIKAMADEIISQLQKEGIIAKHTEGYNHANWILLDFGDIIVHIFDKENRAFYNLERIWGDAKEIKLEPIY